MKRRSLTPPLFFVDSLPDAADTDTRELLRCIEIRAGAADIFVWLKQMRAAPYSYDFIDNKRMQSPRFIIANLPPLKVNTHFLLAFHIISFEENAFIAARFCEPVNPPVSLYMSDLYVEYSVASRGGKTILWCKVKGYLKKGLNAKGFYFFFSIINKIMMTRQLRNIKKLSELTAVGKIETRACDLSKCYIRSGFHWWLFCRRNNCRGLTDYWAEDKDPVPEA